MTRWKSFTVATKREAVDALTRFFVDCGSLGTAHDEQLLGPEGDPADPIPPPPAVTNLTAYFPFDIDLHTLKSDFLEFLLALDASFGAGSAAFIGASEITDGGWGETWKEHFKPVSISRRVVIRPSWEPYEATPEQFVLTIDPGQAFGTGTHETTQMCIRMIDDLFAAGPPPRRVLDLGTGTGILGIAAARMGAFEVLGIDNDPMAVQVSTENAAANGVGDIFRSTTVPLSETPGTFDLVIANIIAEILIDMRDDLLVRLAPGGRMILSGILAEKSPWVRDEFAAAGVETVSEQTTGQWAALLLRRTGE